MDEIHRKLKEYQPNPLFRESEKRDREFSRDLRRTCLAVALVLYFLTSAIYPGSVASRPAMWLFGLLSDAVCEVFAALL